MDTEIIIAIVGVAAVIMVAAIGLLKLFKRRKKGKSSSRQPSQLPVVADAESLKARHLSQAREVAQQFERDLAAPGFDYTVSRADDGSRSNLKQGDFESRGLSIEELIPNESQPAVMLNGSSGSGKSHILKSLFGRLIEGGLIPVFIDLERAAWSLSDRREEEEAGGSVAGSIFSIAGLPGITDLEEVQSLAENPDFTVVVDGLNQISSEARGVLGDYLKGLNCRILATDCLGIGLPPENFTHFAVDELDQRNVEKLYDDRFGSGQFGELSDGQQSIYGIPFFLDLALREKRPFGPNGTKSEIFAEFFRERVGVTDAELDQLAMAVIGSFDKASFLMGDFLKHIPSELNEKLTAADVIQGVGEGQSRFRHDLCRDYLASRYLRDHREGWQYQVFDAVTTYASSLEALTLTIEQQSDSSLKDDFLKAVFDWNYVASAQCISGVEDDLLSKWIRAAIIAAVAEKLFSPFEDSQTAARGTLLGILRRPLLLRHRGGFVRTFMETKSRSALSNVIPQYKKLAPEWYATWRSLFTRSDGDIMTAEEIDNISRDDSILGWAAANTARRSVLAEEQLERIRIIYGDYPGDDKATIRWRAVHVLGKFPDEENMALLLTALSDDYHRVRCGAVRALIELAADNEQLRERIFESIPETNNGLSPDDMMI